MLYRCLSVRSMEYCTSLFVWGLEVCAHLVVGGVCVVQKTIRCNSTSYAPDDGRLYPKHVELKIHQ